MQEILCADEYDNNHAYYIITNRCCHFLESTIAANMADQTHFVFFGGHVELITGL